MIQKKILSKDHVSAAVLEDFESDRDLQAGGEGPCRVYLADRFLKGAICKLQKAPIIETLANLEAERFGIAKSMELERSSE